MLRVGAGVIGGDRTSDGAGIRRRRSANWASEMGMVGILGPYPRCIFMGIGSEICNDLEEWPAVYMVDVRVATHE